MTDSTEIPVMVAIQRSNSKPKFSCILVDRGKKFSMLYQEVSTDVENNNTAGAPSVHFSTSEGGDSFPFRMRITIFYNVKTRLIDYHYIEKNLNFVNIRP